MKQIYLLFACMLFCMQTNNFLEANITDDIAGGAKSAVLYVKKYGSLFGDMSKINNDVNNALQHITTCLGSIKEYIEDILKSATAMSSRTAEIKVNSQSGLSDLETVIPSAMNAVKNIKGVVSDVNSVIADIGSILHAINLAVPSIAETLTQAGTSMKKIDNSSVQKDGDTALDLGQSLPKTVDKFYDSFNNIQQEINSGIESTMDAVDKVMAEASKPLQQLQTYQKSLPAGMMKKLDKLMQSHPYGATQAVKGAA